MFAFLASSKFASYAAGLLGAGNTLDALGAPRSFRASTSHCLLPRNGNPIGMSIRIRDALLCSAQSDSMDSKTPTSKEDLASVMKATQPLLHPSTPTNFNILDLLSIFEDMVVVPGEEIGAGLEARGRWHPDLLAMESPILLAIVEFFLDAVADLEMMI